MNGYTQKPDGINRATKTIYSGLTSGKAKPRPLPSQTVPVLNPELRASIVAKNRTVTMPQALPTKRSVELVRMAEVTEKPITWLWPGFVPLGKLTLLAGTGGTGKSTLAFSMASIVTTAGMWPDATRCNVAGNVLIWSSEDDPADVIKPRLLAMNADVRPLASRPEAMARSLTSTLLTTCFRSKEPAENFRPMIRAASPGSASTVRSTVSFP